jgi:hypothetical protein
MTKIRMFASDNNGDGKVDPGDSSNAGTGVTGYSGKAA